MRERKVGTFTLGCTLVVFGVLFVMHSAGAVLSYEMIFRCWPVILICLGVEVLVCFAKKNQERIHYDKGAILILMLMTVFSMGMAAADLCFQHYAEWMR